jgi:hypothetical protein
MTTKDFVVFDGATLLLDIAGRPRKPGQVIALTPLEAEFELLRRTITPYGGPDGSTPPADGSEGTSPDAGAGGGGAAVIPHVSLLTDLGQDVDDAAALATLIQLHKLGQIVLQSVVATPTTGHAASVAQLMLDYAGLTSVAVGARRGSDVSQADYMNADLTTFYGYPATNSDYPDPVSVLRKSLAAAPDGSAIVCIVGPMPDFYDLLNSSADDIDGRTGNALVKAKCQRITFQGGGDYNASAATVVQTYDFNWSSRPDTVDPVFQALRAMPMEVWCSEGRWGQDDAFSGPLLSAAAVSNPLKKAFDFYQSNNGASIRDTATRRTRASWDVIAAISTIGLGDRFTLAPGFMSFDQPHDNTSTWTRDEAGNFKYLVPAKPVSDVISDLEALYDAYDIGPQAPSAPVITVTEEIQGSVKIAVPPQFFTTLTYATDGESYAALPASGVVTGLTPGHAYTISVKATRYGMSSIATKAYTTKTVAAVTAIETVPGVIRHFDFTDKASILPANVSGTVRLTSVADATGSGKAAAPDGTQGPVYVTSSSFGANRPAIRSVNGDTAGGNVAGAYARLFGDLPELANATDFAVILTAAVNNDRNDNGRIFSIANAGSQDWSSAGGFVIQVPSADRQSVQLYGDHLTGGSAAMAHDTPMLLGVVVKGGSAQLRVGGVDVGDPIAIGALGSAMPQFGLLREVDTDSGAVFGDVAGLVIMRTAPSPANLAYIEAKLAWGATGDGSLLPSGSTYKTSAPA